MREVYGGNDIKGADETAGQKIRGGIRTEGVGWMFRRQFICKVR